MKIIKYYIELVAVIFLLLSSHFLLATDSLITKINDKSINDISRLRLIEEHVTQIYRNDPVEALKYVELALPICDRNNYPEFKAKLLGTVGVGFIRHEMYDKAIDLITRSLDISETCSDTIGVAYSYQDLAEIQINLNNHDKAKEYLLSSIELWKKLNDPVNLNISHTRMAKVYAGLNEPFKSLEYFELALEYARQTGSNDRIGRALNNIGAFYRHAKDYNRALSYYKESLEYRKKTNNPYALGFLLNNIGDIYYQTGNYVKAEQSVQEALKYAEQSGVHQLVSTSYQYLGTILEAEKKYKEALLYYRKYTTHRDSLFNEQVSQKIVDIQVNHEKEKKNREIESLKKINKLKLQKTRLTRNFIGAGGLFILIIALALFLRHRNIVKLNKVLDESKRKFQDMFIKHSAVMMLIDPNTGDIKGCNNSALNYYGYSENEMNAVNLSDLSEADYDEILGKISIIDNNTVLKMQHKMHDSTLKDVEMFITPMVLEGDKLLYTIVQDVTDRNQFQANLQHLNKNLEERVAEEILIRRQQEEKAIEQSKLAALGELAAGIAHEINQPLQSLSFTLDNLFDILREEDIKSPYFSKKAQYLYEDIARIRTIIDHIRVFSRNQSEDSIEVFNVNTSIENALRMVSQQYANKGINITHQLMDSLPEVSGNIYKLEQVILNILTNSRDAILEKAENTAGDFNKAIAISSYVTDKCVHISIEDNGTGLDEEIKKSIFLPFFTTKEPGEGTGLGMSISYGIIKDMRGEIEISSEPGKGTKMIISLPVAEGVNV